MFSDHNLHCYNIPGFCWGHVQDQMSGEVKFYFI